MLKRMMMGLLVMASLTIASVGTASANHGHYGAGHHGGVHHGGGYHGGYGHGGYYNNNYNYVMPLLIGGVIGYELGQPRYGSAVTTNVYPSTPVYQNCTAWVETIDQYGNHSRTRTCY